MSLDATRWAWTQQNLRPMHKLILLSLADRAGADNVAYPSYAQLQADTGADRKTIWKAFKHLQAFGLIEDTLARKGTTKNVIVWRLIGVADRTAQAKNQNKKTASTIPKTEQFRKRNSSENGTLNSSENGTLNSSENGIRNLSVEPTNETTTIVDTRRRSDTTIDTDPLAEAFATFWALYPHKANRVKSLAAYRKLKPNATVQDEILAGLRRYIATKPDWQQWAYASSWLNGRRWEDESHAPTPADNFMADQRAMLAELGVAL